MVKKKILPGIEVLELDYNLAELPSSQHRAGLAGLVLMVQWLKRQGTHKGICEIIRLAERGTTLRINQEGLESHFCVFWKTKIGLDFFGNSAQIDFARSIRCNRQRS